MCKFCYIRITVHTLFFPGKDYSTVLKITACQWSLTIVKASVTIKKPCQSLVKATPCHHDPHYLDIATTFISFNFFSNFSKINFAII